MRGKSQCGRDLKTRIYDVECHRQPSRHDWPNGASGSEKCKLAGRQFPSLSLNIHHNLHSRVHYRQFHPPTSRSTLLNFSSNVPKTSHVSSCCCQSVARRCTPPIYTTTQLRQTSSRCIITAISICTILRCSEHKMLLCPCRSVKGGSSRKNNGFVEEL